MTILPHLLFVCPWMKPFALITRLLMVDSPEAFQMRYTEATGYRLIRNALTILLKSLHRFMSM